MRKTKPLLLIGLLALFAIYAAPRYSELIRHHALEKIITLPPSPRKDTISNLYISIWGDNENSVGKLVQNYVMTVEENNWTPVLNTLVETVKKQKVPVNLNKVIFLPYRETPSEINLFDKINRRLPKSEYNGYSYQYVSSQNLMTETLDEPIEGRKYRIYLSDDLPAKTQADFDFRLYGVLHELGHVFIYESGLSIAIEGRDAEIQCDHFALTVLKENFNDKIRFNRLLDKVIKLRQIAAYAQTPEAKKYDFSKEIEKYRIAS